MKRNIFIIAISAVCLSLLFNFTAFANNINVYVDEELNELTDANGNPVYPFIQNGTTYVPVRGISQALNCIVEWDGENRTVLIYKEITPDGMKFRNDSEDVKLYVDNEEQTLYDANGSEVKPFIKDGTTYVPLRGVSKVLGYPVEWDGNTRSVYVWKNKVSPNGVTLDFLRPKETKVIRRFYESDGQTIEIDGKMYTNAIEYGLWSGAGPFAAEFDLDGKYERVCFVAGSTERHDQTKNIQFIVDGKLVDTITITSNSFAKEYEVELKKGLQLKIVFDDAPSTALGNITFYGD